MPETFRFRNFSNLFRNTSHFPLPSRDKDGCTSNVRVVLVFSWCSRMGFLGIFFTHNYPLMIQGFFVGTFFIGVRWDQGTSNYSLIDVFFWYPLRIIGPSKAWRHFEETFFLVSNKNGGWNLGEFFFVKVSKVGYILDINFSYPIFFISF